VLRVDAFSVRRGAGAAAFLLVLGLAGAIPAVGAPAARLSDVAVRSGSNGQFSLIVKYEGNPAYSCRVQEGAGAETLILEFAAADSSLKPEYRFPDAPLGALKVSALGSANPAGVRLEVPLNGASLKGWGVSSEGLEVLLAAGQKRPVPAPTGGGTYILGVGDRLELTVFGQEDLKKSLEVMADGTVIFPLIGVLPVAGKTLATIRSEVEVRLKDFLVDPQVSLDIKDYQSQPVNVVGEVEKPGTYYLKGPTTLMDIMAQAGWMTREAGSEIIVTRRDSGTSEDEGSRQITITKEELLRGGSQFNPRLQTGDVITVGPEQYFYIRGEVMKPGQYKLGDRPTLLKAVSIAEGLTPYAKKKGIQIIRTVKGSQTKLTFDLKSIEERKAEDVPILPNDVIIVDRRVF
jgi:polysaccharide export outer membrane protein